MDDREELLRQIADLSAQLVAAYAAIGKLHVQLEHKRLLKSTQMREYRERREKRPDAPKPKRVPVKDSGAAQQARLFIRANGPVRPKELATALGIPRKRSGDLLRELYRSGFTTRSDDKLYSLTPKGLEVTQDTIWKF